MSDPGKLNQVMLNDCQIALVKAERELAEANAIIECTTQAELDMKSERDEALAHVQQLCTDKMMIQKEVHRVTANHLEIVKERDEAKEQMSLVAKTAAEVVQKLTRERDEARSAMELLRTENIGLRETSARWESMLEKARKERDEARADRDSHQRLAIRAMKAIEDAPHSITCASRPDGGDYLHENYGISFPGRCDCWKREALKDD